MIKETSTTDNQSRYLTSIISYVLKFCLSVCDYFLIKSSMIINLQCSVPGRKITCNLILIRDMLDYISTKNCPAILANLDQEKAFADRVDWNFTFRLLHHYGFSGNFIRWVKMLYTNISSCIIRNGDLTVLFRPTRGVRRGCPLSPLLYILVAEVLGCNMRTCNNIEGFRIPGGSLFKLT